ncbi:MAG: HAMP domain-containing sensor histidine kinase [Cyclobacteriaceae bacterium]
MEIVKVAERSKSSERFFHQPSTASFVAESTGIIIEANDSFFSLIQRSEAEVLNTMYFQNLLPMGGKIYYNSQYAPLLQLHGKINDVRFEIVRRDHSKVLVLVNSQINREGKIESRITELKPGRNFHSNQSPDKAKIQDMSDEIARLKAQLKEKNAKINEQEEELERLDAIKNKFFNVVSHDMKSPLCGLSGFVNMIIENADDFSKDRMLEVSKQFKDTIDGTVQLADNLINWAQSQMNGFDIHPEIIHPEELVNEVLDLCSTSARKKNIRLAQEIKEQMVVYGDRNQLTFILRNLVNNAIKFTHTGGLIGIEISENEYGDSVLTVTDNGIGLTESQIGALLMQNRNNSTLGTSGEKGTGMGLMLTQEFVQMHGGKLEVTSKKGEGSTFKITLNPLELNKKLLAI